MLKPILIAVIVSAVILTECVLAYCLIPSTADLETWAKTKGDDHKTAKDHGEAGGHGDAHAKTEGTSGHGHSAADAEVVTEVDLGKFTVIVHRPGDNVTLKVNFHLVGTVPEEEHHEFEELVAKCQHRLRDQIIFEIRNSEVKNLTDPSLALLKRRILAKSNELLGKPLLHTIVFSDFAFIEQ